MDVLRRNNVNVWGREHARPIMFAHGYGCDQNMWRFLAPTFAEHYRVVLFDHVGAGHSDLTAYDYAKYGSLEGYASDVLELCHVLDLRDCVFVGHSVSAVIGILAANRAPQQFSALVLVCPSPCYLNDGDYRGGFEPGDLSDMLDTLDSNYLGWASSITPVIMGNPDRPELAAELTNSFCRTDPDIARHWARVTFLSDHRGDLTKSRTRTLVLQCCEDVIAEQPVGEYVHRELANSEYVVLDATGHCPHLSSPDQTLRAISAFLSRG